MNASFIIIKPETLSFFSKIKIIIGVYYTIKYIYFFLSWLYKTFFLFIPDFNKKYGNGWAIITGGTDGIGLSFAKEFLKKKVKVCLIARNSEKLNKVQSELKAKYPNAEIKTITFDFDRLYTEDDVNFLKEQFNKELNNDISILYNNVGYIARGKLDEVSDEEIQRMFNLNILALTYISRIVIEIMAKRKRSLVFASGAVMGRMRFATRAVYSSSKAFMESFIITLIRDYPNIDFTYLNIGPVESNFNKAKSPFRVKPDEFAKSAIRRIGRYSYTTGCLKHDIFEFIFWKVPFMKNIFHSKMEKTKKKNQ